MEKDCGSERGNSRQRIEAKNGLVKYCLTVRSMVVEKKLQGKFEHGDKEYIENAVQDMLNWLGDQVAEKNELEAKLKELEGV
eukprot:12487862-Alexandrium_andersonii.AAC.1